MTHTDFGTDAGAHKRAKFNVTVLVLAQAILGSQMPMIFTIGGWRDRRWRKPLLCDLADFIDCFGFDVCGQPALDDYAALWPTRWFFVGPLAARWVVRLVPMDFICIRLRYSCWGRF